MDLDLSGVSSKSISYRSQDELVESSMATPTTPFLKDCEVVNYASTENPEIIATPEDHIPTGISLVYPFYGIVTDWIVGTYLIQNLNIVVTYVGTYIRH